VGKVRSLLLSGASKVLHSFRFQPYLQTLLLWLAGDKHSSLLRKSVNYGQKSFITLGPGANVIKLFSISLMKRPNSPEPFQPSLTLALKDIPYPIGAAFICFPLGVSSSQDFLKVYFY
jgi:hypothetical protein